MLAFPYVATSPVSSPFSTPHRMRHFYACFAAAFLFLAGCSGPREAARPDLPEGFPNHSVEQILDELVLSPDTLASLRAKASLDIKMATQGGRVTATIHYRRADTLYMSMSAALGIEVARILVTPDSFFVYNRIEKKLEYGSLAYAENALPVPVAGVDGFREMLGLGVPAPEVPWRLVADSAAYVLTDPPGLRRYVIDPAVWRVARYEEFAADGTLVEERAYSEYDRVGGLYLPRRILFRRPLDDTRVSLFYRELTLNPTALDFAFRVSDNAKRVLVDDAHDRTNE